MKKANRSNFNVATDQWFDDTVDGNADDEAIDILKDTLGVYPRLKLSFTKNNLKVIVKILGDVKQPGASKVIKQANDIMGGKFKNEFKNVEGQHSQISEFFSLLSQALNA